MGRALLFLAALSLGLAGACDFGSDAPPEARKAGKEFYDRLPKEPSRAPSNPTS